MIQAVAKNTFRQPPMLLGLERLLLAQPLAHNMRPTKCQRQQGDQFLQALWLKHVRFFKPEAATLQAPEQRFNLPSLGIFFYRCGRVVWRNQDQMFTIVEPHSTHPQLKTPDAAWLVEDQLP